MRKTNGFLILLSFLTALSLLAACGAAATPESFANSSAPEAPAAQVDAVSGKAVQANAPAVPTPAPTMAPAEVDTSGKPVTSDRMIVKNGDIRLLVQDTDVALDRTTQIVGDSGGYIVSSRAWFQDWYGKNYKYISMTIGVPADQFENVLRRLRGLAVRVIDETASGEDVTDQYVDLESQLKNLEATRDRIRSFLDQAKTVEEALKVNQQLTDIESQIEQTKGRMNYLSNRAAYSTITIAIEPDLPPVTPTFTPSPTSTSTPWPTYTPTPWQPGKTFNQATEAVSETYKWMFEVLIWIVVVVLPVLLPFALIGWILWKVSRPKKKV